MMVIGFIRTDFITFCWVLFVLVWLVAALSAKPAKERQSWTGRLVTVGFLAVTFLLLAGQIDLYGLNTRVLRCPPALRITGDCITFIGLVTAIWARLSLGGNWSAAITLKEGHELVEWGPYRFIRHPIYTGLLLMVLGTAVVVGTPGAFIAFVICFFGVWQKLHQEEALLTKHFPDAYPQYMSRTKALIPFLL